MTIPMLEVEFDKDGQFIHPDQETAILSFLTGAQGAGTTDILLLSHGWNNNIPEARKLYSDFLSFLQADPLIQNRKLIAIGILWPSKRFDDADLIAGGAAGLDQGPSIPQLHQQIDRLKDLLPNPTSQSSLDSARQLLDKLEADPKARTQFVQLLGNAMQPELDPAQRTPDEGTRQLTDVEDATSLLTSLAQPIGPQSNVNGGGAAALGSLNGPLETPGASLTGLGRGAAGIGDLFGNIKQGALRLLNLVTYSTMKDRAGKIGRNSVNPLLSRIQRALPAHEAIRFHLVGHSFGGRVVTAAADGPNPIHVDNLFLLQGAYSHNGLSSDFDGRGTKGFFESVVSNKKVAGRILITHSIHDRAVGLAYPLVSRLNHQDASDVGDANDRFGGIGANGALHVPGAKNLPLLAAAATYDFGSGPSPVFNFNSDAFISGHSDVARPETAHLLASAMTVGVTQAMGATTGTVVQV